MTTTEAIQKPDPDLAWAAGLFEGEGCFAMAHSNGNPHLRARLAMTDGEIVHRFGQVVGYGHVGGPYNPPSKKRHGHAPHWDWQLTGKAVIFFFALLEPYLGSRRKERFYELWTQRLEHERTHPGAMSSAPDGLAGQFKNMYEYLLRVDTYYRKAESAVEDGDTKPEESCLANTPVKKADETESQ